MPSTMQMQSISGIITQIHVSSKEVPPALVGASTNIIGNKVYVFGGRLATSRKMTNHLYILDLDKLCWTRHIPPPDSESPPTPRYFHSASDYKQQLLIFGGMGYSKEESTAATAGLCVLDDVIIFDTETACWKRPDIQPSIYSPQARYAHLSSVTEEKLLVIGGQDLENNYLDEMSVLNLNTWEWEHLSTFDKHVGAYKSIAVKAPPGTRFTTSGMSGITSNSLTNGSGTANNSDMTSFDAESTSDDSNSNNAATDNASNINTGQQQQQQRRQRNSSTNSPSNATTTATSTTSTTTVRQIGPVPIQTIDEVTPIYLYTNYNFADVKRELKLIFPNSNKSASNALTVEDYSNTMNGAVMPPGLRFPTGHALGNHLILAGTYLSPNVQAYAIWAFDIGNQTWNRIETGNVFNSGSWNRGLLHEPTNRFIVFGNMNRSLLDDYSHRQINFDHIAIVDMEAFGVYSLPKSTCSSLAQEMGLRLLNEPAVSDFYIITQDDMTIPVNSAVLCQRWPYFANLLSENQKKLKSRRTSFIKPSPIKGEPTTESISPDTEEELSVISSNNEDRNGDGSDDRSILVSEKEEAATLKSQYMLFPYPYTVVIALLQFIYTDNLLTAQQYQPSILAQLLLLSDMYDLPRLKALATHALHQMLNITTAPLIFETAALSHQTSLQVRALKMMIAAKKMIQEQQLQQQRNQPHMFQSLPQQLNQQHSALRSRTVSTPLSSSRASHIDRSANNTPSPSVSLSSFARFMNNDSASTRAGTPSLQSPNTNHQDTQQDTPINDLSPSNSTVLSPTLPRSFIGQSPPPSASAATYRASTIKSVSSASSSPRPSQAPPVNSNLFTQSPPNNSTTTFSQQAGTTPTVTMNTVASNPTIGSEIQRPASPILKQKSLPMTNHDNDDKASSTRIIVKPVKEKKKKNAFLGAFSKFSSSK